MPWSEKFRAAIEEGVRDIADGELHKLNADEKRQLLAILRKLDDCPDGWKNKRNMAPKKQKNIPNGLHQAIARLVNPEKARAISASANKKRRENGKAEEYAADPINKEKRAKYNHEYAADPINKEKKAKYNHKYNADPINKERQAKYKHEYKADPINKDKANARSRERYATDINYRTMRLLRGRLRHALGNNKKDHTMDLIGCTVEQMLQHIESQFTPGMTWDNQGKGDDEWQIDHIIPFVAFDTSNRDEQFIVSWYQNLQPLWGPDNWSKGGKYTEEGKQDLIRRYNEHKK
jgi:hypothetical protein